MFFFSTLDFVFNTFPMAPETAESLTCLFSMMKEKVEPFFHSDWTVIPVCFEKPSFRANFWDWYSPIPVPDLLIFFVVSNVENN